MERCRVAATQVDVRHLDVAANIETHVRLIAETHAGPTIARSEPGCETAWISAELDPDLLERVRESAAFALRKRRPEAYAELVAHL